MQDPEDMFSDKFVPILDKDCTNMSFHGNQIGGIVAILLLKIFY